MFVASGGDHFAYEQCVAFTIQTILMPFIAKYAVFLESALTNFVHLFNFVCLKKSEKSGNFLV